MSLNKNTLLLSGALALGTFNANAQDAGKETPVVRNYGIYGEIGVADSIRNMLGQERLAIKQIDEQRYQVSALDTIGSGEDIVRARSYFLKSENGLLDANEIVGREVVYARMGESFFQSGLRIVEKMDTLVGRLVPFIEGANWTGNAADEAYNVHNEFEEIRPFIPVTLTDKSEEKHSSFDYDQLVSYLEGEMQQYGADELWRNVELLDAAAEKAESHYILTRSITRLWPDLK
jgi:hypothetical protein